LIIIQKKTIYEKIDELEKLLERSQIEHDLSDLRKALKSRPVKKIDATQNKDYVEYVNKLFSDIKTKFKTEETAGVGKYYYYPKRFL
jgi:intein/homing endonuclease